MTVIRIKGKEINPECPLCKRTFKKITHLGEDYFVCLPCTISINVKDPSVYLWESYVPAEEKEIMCVNEKCGEAMNFFFRSDGFMKAYCPKCKSSLATENLPARVDKPKYTAPDGELYYDK